MSYPHYTFDGCHWFCYLSAHSRLTLHDGYDDFGESLEDHTGFAHITCKPAADEMPVTAARFKAARKRIKTRLDLAMQGKPTKHLEPSSSDRQERHTWKIENRIGEYAD